MAASAAAVISSSAVSAAAVVPSGSSAGLIGQVVLGNKSLDLDKSVSAGEVESALVVYLANLDYDLVADSNDILNTVNVLDIKMADVYKTLFAGSDLNECAEVHQAGNNTLVDSADLGIVRDGLNHIESALRIVNVDSGDEDGSVLFNVDLAVALCADLLDNLALLADDIADLLGVNLGGEHLGSILGELFSGLGDNGQHDFIEDVAACLVGLVKSLADDGGGQTVYFKIHLDGSDTLEAGNPLVY